MRFQFEKIERKAFLPNLIKTFNHCDFDNSFLLARSTFEFCMHLDRLMLETCVTPYILHSNIQKLNGLKPSITCVLKKTDNNSCVRTPTPKENDYTRTIKLFS